MTVIPGCKTGYAMAGHQINAFAFYCAVSASGFPALPGTTFCVERLRLRQGLLQVLDDVRRIFDADG